MLLVVTYILCKMFGCGNMGAGFTKARDVHHVDQQAKQEIALIAEYERAEAAQHSVRTIRPGGPGIRRVWLVALAHSLAPFRFRG